MTEAELAMEEKLRRKREEEQQLWQEYIEQRDAQRRKEEDELKKLKERQIRRKAQRAEQERLMHEMRRKQEETRQREIDERKAKEAEAKRMRLEEAEQKRLAMQEAIKKRDEAARQHFIVPKRSADSMQHGPIVVGMREVMKTKEQLAEDKKIAMKYRLKPLKIQEGMRTAELKKIVNDLFANIVQLESDKYDLEEERNRQEYHLKELLERQKQINKNKALKMGLDIEDLNSSKPPKVRLASKYERKVDRRTFDEKTSLFDGDYIKMQEECKEKQHEQKVNQFKEVHGDKHVPKWDPSAPRRDTYEPGTVIYEESDEDDDYDLVEKLREYVGESKPSQQQQQPLSQSRQASVTDSRRSSRFAADEQQAQQQQYDRDAITRRRSSQLSTASKASVASSKASQQSSRTQQQASQPPSSRGKSQQQAPADEEEEDEDEEYEEEEEEYTDEEE